VVPGLVDAHVHTALVDVAAVLAGGISAVWDLGANPATVAELARRHPGSVRYAGPFLTAPGGYPADRTWAPAGSCREVHSAADAADAVAEAHETGATLVKTTLHTGGPTLPGNTLTALITAAHARRLPVVVHAEGPGTLARAYDSGADLLAHTPWTETPDDTLVRACAERMTWISTLDIHGYGRDTPERVTAIGNLRRFFAYGGSIRYGTDLGNGPLPLGVNPRELRALQSAGLSPTDILTTITDPAAPPCEIPAGLDLDPAHFATSLATARVLPLTTAPEEPDAH
jgi:imidazolonepropionase-like amidohydrolase